MSVGSGLSEADGRAAVIAEALSWQKTPWHHSARVKGAGVDCVNFLVGAYAGAGLIEPFDLPPYPRDWHVHRDIERMLMFIRRIGDQIDEADAKPADACIFKIGRVFSHSGILVDWPQIVHASQRAGMVTLGDLDRDDGLVAVERLWFRHRAWMT